MGGADRARDNTDWASAVYRGYFGVLGAMSTVTSLAISVCLLVAMSAFSLWVGLALLALLAAFWWVVWFTSREHEDNQLRARAEESVSLARDWIRTEHGREPLDEDEVFRVVRTRFPI